MHAMYVFACKKCSNSMYTSVVLVKVLVIVVNKKVLVIYMVFNVIRTW